jgi:hypothetical protein
MGSTKAHWPCKENRSRYFQLKPLDLGQVQERLSAMHPEQGRLKFSETRGVDTAALQ